MTLDRFFPYLISILFVLMVGSFAHASDANVVNVYSASKEHLIKPALDQFTKETGIKVNYTTIGGAALTARLELEGEDTPADAVINADVGNLYHLQEKDLLQPMDVTNISKVIPDVLREPTGLWTAVAMRSRVIFYRTEDGKPNIDYYADLADDAWKGKVLARSSTNVYNQSLMADIIYRIGEEAALDWAKSVVANFTRAPEGGDRDQLKALASGVGTVAIANTYYFGQMLTSDDPAERAVAEQLSFIIPKGVTAKDDKGAHINIRAAAITKHAKNKAEAQKLMEFLVTEPAQRFFADSNREFVVNKNVHDSDIVKGWGFVPTPNVPLIEIGKRNADATAVFDEANWP